MSCLKNSCNISDPKEIMITCWLCDNVFHAKCINIPIRVVDVLAEDRGLRWCCVNCKKMDIDFYKFVKSNRNKFNDIKNDLILLSSKVEKYGEIFENFKSLDKLISPSSSSPKRKRSSKRLAVKPTDIQVPETINSVTLDPTANTRNGINYNKNITPAPVINSINNAHVPINTSLSYAEVALNQPDPAINIDQINDNTIRAVPPKKTVFISRLAIETTAEAVDSFVKSKVGPNAEISTYKFVFSQPRSITSFKVTVSADLFERILDPNFWPENTLVREYKYREKPRSRNFGRLPQHVSNVPKN